MRFHAALRLLLSLQMKAQLRRLGRSARSVKGALYLCTMLGLFGIWLVPLVLSTFLRGSTEIELMRSSMIQTYLAPGLLAYCVITLITSGADSGIYFQPAEVDLLFPGPFSRRELLLYRLCSLSVPTALLSVMMAMPLLSAASNWAFALIGVFLAAWFIQLVPMVVALSISIVGVRAFTSARKVIVGVLLAVIMFESVSQAAQFSAGNWRETVRALRESPVGQCLLAPFDVFASAITARTLVPEFLGWGALAILLDGVLVALVLLLDANFQESSIAISQRMYERIRAARNGQAWTSLVRNQSARLALPQFPRWAGAGPMMWRQCTTALRGMRGLSLFIAIMACGLVVPLLFIGHREARSAIFPALGMMPMMLVFILPQMLQFDFRGDLERFDVLKALPLSPTAVTLGQLCAPVIVATAIEAVFVIAAALLAQMWHVGFTIAILVLPSVNLLIFGIENLAFLWYPHRTAVNAPGDIQVVGHQFMMMAVKMLALFVVAGATAGVGGLVWWLTGGSWPVVIAAGWVMITAVAFALIPFIADAFRRFDPSAELLA